MHATLCCGALQHECVAFYSQCAMECHSMQFPSLFGLLQLPNKADLLSVVQIMELPMMAKKKKPLGL